MPYKDPEKAKQNQRERNKRWRERHPEKVKTANRRTRERLDWNQYTKDWRQKHPTKVKEIKRRSRLKQYGLTIETFNALLKKQHHQCKICLKPFEKSRDINIDHNHKTGKVRGLLCARCNPAIGSLMEDEFILARAIAYLKWSKTITDESWTNTRFVDLATPLEHPNETCISPHDSTTHTKPS